MVWINAVVQAVVEGLTEFLPISSTGHLLLVSEWFPLSTGGSDAFPFAFIVIIQLPAILAVVVYFWKTLWPFRGDDIHRDQTIMLWLTIIGAFIPAAFFGFLLDDFIEYYLLGDVTVALALVVGGIVLIAIERRKQPARYETVHDIGVTSAMGIGLFQCLAMIPGTSRSAASIIGGMLLGASRPAAAEFSFFLAIPTMLGATTLKVMKNGLAFSSLEWALIGVGSVVSFVTAYAAVAFLMGYIKRHDFKVFGYYRIVLGVIVLVYVLVMKQG